MKKHLATAMLYAPPALAALRRAKKRVKGTPFWNVARLFGHQENEGWLPETPPLSDKDLIHIEAIGRAVRALSRRLPRGRSSCLVEALAARDLLLKKNLPWRLHVGLRKNTENRREAHAWLESGGIIITGHDQAPLFTEVAVFTSTNPED